MIVGLVAIIFITLASRSLNAARSEFEINSNIITGCRNPSHAALTFDDGISEYTDELLDILDENKIKATFFILGSTLNSYPNKRTLVRMIRSGHVAASHSYDHPDFTGLTKDEMRSQIERTESALKSVIGVRPRYFRPPYGYVNQKVVNFLRSSGYLIVNWNVDTDDWRFQHGIPRIMKQLKKGLKSSLRFSEGPIILQHDRLKSSIMLQEGIIRLLQRRGYELVTLHECIDEKPYRH